MIMTDRIPDVGVMKARHVITGEGTWIVTISINGLTPENARILAAELLNAAEDCEKFTEAGR